MPSRTRSLVLILAATLSGCGPSPDEYPDTPFATSRTTTGSRFDPTTTGTIRGRVVWHGTVPDLPLKSAAIPDGAGGHRWADMPNPFAPVIDEKSRGLAHAVVYLSGIEPEAGRPWDLPPARVVMAGHRIVVKQFDSPEERVGIIRRGDELEMVSADQAVHSLRARGATFFTLPFPDPEKPLRRRMDAPGLVELTSGAGYYWAAADLFVADHPYYAITDREGRFTLPQVPQGKYELACWVRNWHVIGQDRDPETGLIARQRYALPVEKKLPLDLTAVESTNQTFQFDVTDFPSNAMR